jgi:hypothetical protein
VKLMAATMLVETCVYHLLKGLAVKSSRSNFSIVFFL